MYQHLPDQTMFDGDPYTFRRPTLVPTMSMSRLPMMNTNGNWNHAAMTASMTQPFGCPCLQCYPPSVQYMVQDFGRPHLPPSAISSPGAMWYGNFQEALSTAPTDQVYPPSMPAMAFNSQNIVFSSPSPAPDFGSVLASGTMYSVQSPSGRYEDEVEHVTSESEYEDDDIFGDIQQNFLLSSPDEDDKGLQNQNIDEVTNHEDLALRILQVEAVADDPSITFTDSSSAPLEDTSSFLVPIKSETIKASKKRQIDPIPQPGLDKKPKLKESTSHRKGEIKGKSSNLLYFFFQCDVVRSVIPSLSLYLSPMIFYRFVISNICLLV
eukprot:TRINITY_DN2501_c0_g1_i2.p1 TRINITY_DN2501_c0_g1~~TRINITY_DN2501_c0_g1_i2.p1  ORF type:complete len:323 (-),score=22.79 TRINITY_DN2501_c0_g1_i2:515-1483(-)